MESETQVMIIGAGPSGLALATTLAASGVAFVLIDRLAAQQQTSRAAVIHARTLEVLEKVGVSDALVAAGLQVPVTTLREGKRVLVRVDFSGLRTRYPFILALPQNHTEAILTERLQALGGAIQRGQEAVGVQQDAEGATVTLRDVSGASARDGSGASASVRARFVVGTDGYHSLVRQTAGIAFDTGTYPEAFILADVHMDWPFVPNEMTLFLSPAGLMLAVPFPGQHYRVVASVQYAPAEPHRGDVQMVLDRCTRGSAHMQVRDVIWSSRFRIHHGVAGRYRAGRVFLAGDAAHVHSPAGGQGMNTGIQDAVDLGERLAAVIHGNMPETSLDGYESARRPVAQRVVQMTDQMTRVATLSGPVGRFVRTAGLMVAGQLPPVRQMLAARLAELN